MAPGEIATTSRPLPLTGCIGSMHNACTPCSTTRPRLKSKPTTTGPKPTLRRQPRNDNTQTLHKTRDLTGYGVFIYLGMDGKTQSLRGTIAWSERIARIYRQPPRSSLPRIETPDVGEVSVTRSRRKVRVVHHSCATGSASGRCPMQRENVSYKIELVANLAYKLALVAIYHRAHG